MRKWTQPAAVALVPLLLASAPLAAQDDCFPGPTSNEARAFGVLSAPLAFTGAGPVTPSGGLSIGLEAASIPAVPADAATPTTCRPGKGPENTNPLPGFLRLRLGWQFHGMEVEAGWIPPVTLEGVRANLVGLAIARTVSVGSIGVGVRGHALLGSLTAPVTCDEEAIADPPSECFGGEISNDRWRPGIRGVEATATGSLGAVRVHVGLGYSRLRPRFQVDFTNAVGETDRRRVEVDLDRAALFGGLSLPLGWATVTTEAYHTVHDRVTLRLVLRTVAAR
jgi:hypothetical protein